MSKESKPRDLWRQVFACAHDRPDTWCVGCGYYRVVRGVHRADCTANRQCGCGAQLTRPESLRPGRCLECRLCDTTQTTGTVPVGEGTPMNPVMTLRWMVDDEEQSDKIHVLWTVPTDNGWVSLLSHPELNYLILQHDEPFIDGQGLDGGDLGLGDCITLGRPDAGQLALALITALINNSDELINSYIERTIARPWSSC